MRAETLEGHLGTSVTVDLCLACQVFWFDRRESLQLAPASILALFHIIGEQASPTRPVPPAATACPRCSARLLPTHDLQRNTRFEYLHCPAGHGRLTSFFDFLREKDFIRPLSPAQIAELRRNVQVVNCSNCGAPVDLAHTSTCEHCGSALSMLDLKQAEALVAQLQHAERPGGALDPTLPMRLAEARQRAEAAFAPFPQEADWFPEAGTYGLVGAGLGALARWLSQRIR